jgi:hypothetical protein
MKKKQFTEEQIIAILWEADASGATAAMVARAMTNKAVGSAIPLWECLTPVYCNCSCAE